MLRLIRLTSTYGDPMFKLKQLLAKIDPVAVGILVLGAAVVWVMLTKWD